jgi:hypothetical protein
MPRIEELFVKEHISGREDRVTFPDLGQQLSGKEAMGKMTPSH